jgi:HK97 family phage major capsid protein
MGTGKKGGFLVPTEFDSEIRSMLPEDSVIRPNAIVIPASGSTPDAALELPTLDQTGDKGVFGGLVFNWTGETGKKKSAGDVEFIMVKLEPNNVTGYVEVANKLLDNTESFASYLQQIMAGALSSLEDFVFYLGDGNGKPKGILNSKAVIKITRKTSGKISYSDLTSINGLIKGTNLKWVMNRTALPELQNMVAEDTHSLVWQAGLVPGAPDTILGIPLLYNEHSPVLGEYGDIALLDMKQYAIKDGTGLAIRIDDISQYEFGKTRIYISMNVDGQSLIADSILSEDKKTRISPFVVLNK